MTANTLYTKKKFEMKMYVCSNEIKRNTHSSFLFLFFFGRLQFSICDIIEEVEKNVYMYSIYIKIHTHEVVWCECAIRTSLLQHWNTDGARKFFSLVTAAAASSSSPVWLFYGLGLLLSCSSVLIGVCMAVAFTLLWLYVGLSVSGLFV